MWPAIIGAVGSLIGSNASQQANARTAADQRQAEEREAEKARWFGAAEAEKARQFSSTEAGVTRDWTRDMSSTAHQREVRDLRAAGLNPVLSGTGGMGSASPAGAMASTAMASSAKANAAMGAPAPDYGRAVGSAMEMRRNFEEVKNLKMQNEQIYADTALKKQDAALRSYDMDFRKQQERTSMSDQLLRQQELETEKQNTRRASAQASIFGSTAKGAQLEGEIDETTYGKVMRYIDRAMKSISGGSRSARDVGEGFNPQRRR